MENQLTSVFGLLQSNKLEEIIKEDHRIQQLKAQNSYNLFTLSSTNTHLENFHSDVMAELLDPRGRHGKGNLFLMEFIRFLNAKHQFELLESDFEQANVIREKGRIDILIKTSSTAIIIENKINNAPDMEEQLLRYYRYCIDRNLEVKAIIYLSLDGLKFAPKFNEIPSALVKNIAAFNNKKDDLVSGWLEHCMAYCMSLEEGSLIHQCIKLLQHLGQDCMDIDNMDALYNLLNTPNNLEKLEYLLKFWAKIPKYRADKLQQAIGKQFTPFQKCSRWKDDHLAYEAYNDGSYQYKLDIWFEPKRVIIRFSLMNVPASEESNNIIGTKLQQIGFNLPKTDYGSYDACFDGISSEKDDKIRNFVKNFILKLGAIE